MHVSPRLIVTTGAADGSSPSWCSPSWASRRVEVDDRGVGREPGARRVVGAVRVARPRARPSVGELARQRLHRRAVGVVGGARVRVGLPVPPEAHRLHASSGGPAGRVDGAIPPAAPPTRGTARRAAAARPVTANPASGPCRAGPRVRSGPVGALGSASPSASWRGSATTGSSNVVGTPPSALVRADLRAEPMTRSL